jgi:hypothetical protein
LTGPGRLPASLSCDEPSNASIFFQSNLNPTAGSAILHRQAMLPKIASHTTVLSKMQPKAP